MKYLKEAYLDLIIKSAFANDLKLINLVVSYEFK